MASYKTNPPLRDADSNPPRRMATHTQPSRGENREYREAEVAHPLGQTDTRRRMQVSQPMGGARPHMRDPPSLRSRPEAQKAPSSSLRFGRPETRPMGPDPPPLRAKSSRNVLRRKPSSIAQTGVPTPAVQSYMPPAPVLAPPTTGRRPSATAMQFTERRPSNDQTLRSAEAYHDIFTRTGPRVPSATQATQPIIPELDRYRSRPEDTVPSRRMELPHKLSTQDLPPPFPTTIVTPVYSGGSSSGQRYSGYSGSGYSVSPSTRFSESPGPGCGAYSRDTTPTSMSSPSPGIYLPVKAVTPRQRQGSASTASNRPPVSSVTRRKGGSISEIDVVASPVDSSGLSVVRESLTSSSSNSTVKGDASAKEKKKKKRLSPLPPSPPPRKSSQKFNKPSPGDFDSPSKASPSPARPLMTSPSESSPARPARPVRPSREGTPDLQSQLGASVTVIQSNLPALSFAQQDRRRSAIPPPLQVQTNLRPQGTRIPSRNPSPGPIPPSPREGTPAPSGLGIVPDLRPPITPALRSSSRGTTPSPSQATRPRFGLFGRRKTEPVIETKEKAPRKGPAAGTGHEGYGKYGVRGRSSSAGGPRARERSLSIASSSQESMASTPATYDPFLLHRMSPVIIAGGGEIIENRNSGSELIRTESSTSLVMDRGRPSVDSRGSSKSNLGHGAERTTLWPSAMPKEPTRRISGVSASKGRRPSDSSDDGFGRSRLALRRSVQRLGDATGVLNLPRPLNIPSTGMSSSMTSLDASLMSDDSQMQTGSGILPHGRKGQLTKPKKLEKRPKSPTKWNFFHRSKPSTKTTAPAMAVTVGKATAKSVPHYALLDSSDEQPDIDPADLEDIMMDAAVVDLSNEELDALQFGSDKFKSGHMDDILVNLSAPLELKPAPIIFSSPEPITPVLPPTELHLVKETAPIRPSRLPQVGRIPKVISARPETTSPKSFSRPFARLSVAQPQPQVVADRQSVALGPSPPKPSTPEPAIPGTSLRQTSGDSKAESASTASHLDFLAFSPRKNSEATTNSSGGLSFVGTTAIIPEPDADLEEDEVWGEYDDLIENDETIRVPGSATSSHGVPFQYESYESRRIRKSKMLPKESPTLTEAPKISHSDERVSHLTSSSVYSQEMSTRLKEALTALPTPTTPLSFTDFISSYRDRNIDSASKPNRSSHNSSRKSGSSSYSSQMSMEEQENPSPRSQVNLRVGSMTVSKWLTFGHVLFSPARDDVDQEGVEKAQSVLVIDGLGNDDWSFYAAETYPNCTIYNLSPTAAPPTNSLSPTPANSFPLTPPNHRQTQFPSPSSSSYTTTKFPFPPSTFAIVVFRFPVAMSESAYKHTISEAKRVLKPGGYLELAILDLDMLNMGNRARRAVRGLKVKMQIAEPGVSLGSASDIVLRLVAKRGFCDVKSCNVGVPVASSIATGASSSRDGKQKVPVGVKQPELSLADLLKNDSPSSDEGIAKMVAKVGRWWYTRCYESVVLPASPLPPSSWRERGQFGVESSTQERSIWYADGGRLLSECEKRNASFKLVVAYAQKPALGRGGSGGGIGGKSAASGSVSSRRRGMSV